MDQCCSDIDGVRQGSAGVLIRLEFGERRHPGELGCYVAQSSRW
jgi:hypothetical protein